MLLGRRGVPSELSGYGDCSTPVILSEISGVTRPTAIRRSGALRLAAGLMVLATMLGLETGHAWEVNLTGSTRVSSDLAQAIGVTSGGDPLVLGVLGGQLTLARLARSSGAPLWRRAVSTLLATSLISYEDGSTSAREIGPVQHGHDSAVIGGAGVEKIDARTGAEIWSWTLEHGMLTRFDAIAVDATGDVIAAGVVIYDDHAPGWDALVVKLDGATGEERWRRQIDGTSDPSNEDDLSTDRATAVAVDAVGDVVVGGLIEHLGEPRFAVVKLAAASGTILWQQDATTGEVASITIDGAGDVLAAGRSGVWNVVVRKLAGEDGTELWQHHLSGSGPAVDGRVALALAPAGDAIVASTLANATTGLDLTVVRLVSRTGDERWRKSFGGRGDRANVFRALTVAPGAHVVVAGLLSPAAGESDFTTISLDVETGAVQWQAMATGTAGAGYGPEAIAADPSGDVIVGGVTNNVDTGSDMTVVKIAGDDGGQVWRRDFTGIAGGFGDGSAVATTSDGDVIAAGDLTNGDSDFTVARLGGPVGAERWRREINGQAFSLARGNDRALAVAVDAHDEVAAAGVIADERRTEGAFAVVKLAGDTGEEQWRSLIAGSSSDCCDVDTARTVAFDPLGDVVAAGYLHYQNSGLRHLKEMFVVKLAGESGAERWRHIIQSQDGEAFAVAVDPTGDVVVAGAVSAAKRGSDFIVLKLAATTGSEVWRYTLRGRTDEPSVAQKVTLDPAGDVVVVGRVVNALDGGDLVIAKLDRATGAERWRRTFTDGTLTYGDSRGIAVDLAGDVVALGLFFKDAGVYPLVAIKLSGATGDDRWRRALSQYRSNWRAGLAVDRDGDVGVTGATGTGSGTDDLLVVKLGGAHGVERWRRAIAGTAGADDVGAAVAFDAEGNVAVVGQTVNVESGWNLTVAKLRGGDGSDALANHPRGCDLAVRRAAGVVLTGRLTALQRCRNLINDGRLELDPASCVEMPATRRVMAIAGARARALVTGRCTDAVLADLNACATSVDAIVAPDGLAGCLVRASAGAADTMIAAEYGRVLGRGERAARACQEAIAIGSRRLTRRLVGGLETCGRGVDTGRLLASVPCTGGADGAGRMLRDQVAAACDDALVASIDPCASDLEALASAAGTGCLAVLHADAIGHALRAAPSAGWGFVEN